ncbi:MAG: tetratricopeptide repeat protein [Bdellovibrionota bacterium]
MVLSLYIIACSVSACSNISQKTTLGAIIGGLVGGSVGAVVGHQSDEVGAGVAIGAAAGAGIGALIGANLEDGNSSSPDKIITSQDRAFYPVNNNFSDNYETSNFIGYNETFSQNESGNFAKFAYNDNSFNGNSNLNKGVSLYSSGYYGAINGGTYSSDYNSNLLNYVNTGQTKGYLGALNIDKGIMPNKIMPNKEEYITNNYATNNTYNNNTYASINDIPNAQNIEYPKASYSWDNNPINKESGVSVNNVSLNADIYNELSNDCEKAKAKATLAKQTEVLADKLFYYRKALRLCPSSPEYHNGLGEVYMVLNRREDAVFEFKEALKLNPEFYTAKKNLNIAENKY